MAICIPESPAFDSDAERKVWNQLKADLRENDYLISGLRVLHQGNEVQIDFLTIRPGKGVAVVEVKGGWIRQDELGQITTTNGDGESDVINPDHQAIRNHRAVSDLVYKHWSLGYKPKIAWVVAFPDSELPLGFGTHGLPRNFVVDSTELSTLVDLIDSRCHETGQEKISRETSELFKNALLSIRDPQRRWAEEAVSHEHEVKRLTEEQFEFLSFIASNGSFLITGPAGSGKTFLAIEQLRRLAAEGKRVAFICYSVGLANYVQELSRHWPVGARPAWVGNFHKLATKWGVAPPNSPTNEWWLETCPELMLEELADNRDRRIELFDAIIVDEAQDFPPIWWTVMQEALSNKAEGGLYLFGASDQDVFNRDSLGGLPLNKFQLTKNLRCARPIIEFASLLTDKPPTNHGVDGPPIRFVEAGSSNTHPHDLASDLVDLIQEEGWLPKDIVLLTTKHRHPVHKARADEDKVSYWEGYWDPDDIFFCTVAGYKGLERAVTVVAVDNFHDGVDPRDVMYVGATRARDLLIVVGNSEELKEQIGEAATDHLLRNEWRPINN